MAEPATRKISENLGRSFYNSGSWRFAVMYICTADMSGVKLRNEDPYVLYVPGVDFRGSDLRFMNLSQATFSDITLVDDLSFTLQADLAGIIYNEFTTWPSGFTPPPSSPEPPDVP
jgi:hypothetical protein